MKIALFIMFVVFYLTYMVFRMLGDLEFDPSVTMIWILGLYIFSKDEK